MKPRENSCKKRALPKTTDPMMKRLAVYSATAGAALLVAPVADAAIQNITGLSISLDLPQNGGVQTLSFAAGPFHGSMQGSNQTRVTTLAGPSFPTGPSSFPTTSSPGVLTVVYLGQAVLQGNVAGSGSLASRPAKGIAFSGMNFSTPAHRLAYKSQFGASSGNFLGRSGYVAFKTNSYYGWLKVKVDLDSNGVPNQISLVDNGNGVFGAYDNINDVIADGFTVGAVAAPEPSTVAISGLGLLAFGAAGVCELRRRRQKAAGN